MDESDSYLEKDLDTDATTPGEPRATGNRRGKKEKEKEPPPSEEARRMALLVQSVEKEFGKGSITRLGDVDTLEPMPVIPTGSLALDKALGVGGYPRGRIVEVFGPESSGKTTLALHAIAQAQAAGGVAAFIDAEHAFDLRYAKAIGVDLDRLLVSQPDNGEQALDIAELLSKTGDISLVVVDSVAALVPKAELEGDMGEPHMGLHARLMSQATRKLNGVCSRTGTTLLFINQLRMKLGVVFGNPETTTGGAALKYYASVRLDVRRIGKVSIGDTVVGNRTRVKVVKNKVAPPFTEAEFDIRWGKGVDEAADLIEMALACGILEKNGSHLVLDGKSIGQGRDRARDALLGDGELLEYVRLATIESLPGQTSRALPPVKAGGARDAAEAAA